jgi:hypothetical protein
MTAGAIALAIETTCIGQLRFSTILNMLIARVESVEPSTPIVT